MQIHHTKWTLKRNLLNLSTLKDVLFYIVFNIVYYNVVCDIFI